MSFLKNPFGLRNNEIVLVSDLSPSERGLACNCCCPSCGERFEARLGMKREHHFAHSGEGCDETVSFLVGMYQLLQEFVLSHKLLIPELIVYWNPIYEGHFSRENFYDKTSLEPSNSLNKCTKISNSIQLRFDTCEIKYKGKRPIALVLSYKNNFIAVRIIPPPNACKDYSAMPFENYATLSLDLSDCSFESFTKSTLFQELSDKIQSWSWISNPKSIKALDAINDENNRLTAERKKRIEEQNRKQEELKERQRKEFNAWKASVLNNQPVSNSPLCDKKPRPDLQSLIEQEDRENKEWQKQSECEEVKDKFTQQTQIIYSSFGNRMVRCELCGFIGYTTDFPTYGGSDHVNLGICYNCAYGKR